MNISRRTILKSAAIGAATAIGSAVTRAPALAESDTVKGCFAARLVRRRRRLWHSFAYVHEGRYRRDQRGRRLAEQEDVKSIRRSIKHQKLPALRAAGRIGRQSGHAAGVDSGASREATRPVLRRHNVSLFMGRSTKVGFAN